MILLLSGYISRQQSENKLFAVLFGAGILLTLCNAACFTKEPEIHEPPINGCFFEDEVHSFSSDWVTKDCMKCRCDDGGTLTCCQMLGLPIYIGRSDCEVLEDKKTCTYRIVYTSDHTKDCRDY
ncbi:beta-microseminoprotein-like [Engystomops pustulosus]|uniref:beta-microseminoprotein-like n=1 Tax=Engystomops pustulosus TaxID=76066 RepID=UPI003AFB306A